ncbi:MAG: clostripain-related cysteine peptidase [Planctomycetota bacterium]
MPDRKQIIVILFFLFLHFSIIFDFNVNAENNEKEDIKEWTVICYLAGDNFLDWFMKENIKELIKAGSSNSVSVLALLDTTDDDTKVFEFNKDDLVRIPTRIVKYSWTESELNTGDPQTFIDYASWAVREYPAKKYFIILGGYGEGWIGLMHDMNNGQGDIDVLSLNELDYALKKITKEINDINGKETIDILGLDACYMGMLEIMYQIKDYADYLVSSENEEALDGWPYDKLVESIIENPEMDGLYLSSSIVDTYLDSVKGSPSKMSNVLTLSVVNLKFIGKIAEEIDILASLLLKMRKESPRKLAFTEKITNKFHISAHIAGKYVPYSVLIDLNDFVMNLRVGMTKNKPVSESAQRISRLLSKAIIKERHQPLKGEYNLGIGGISLYFAGMDTKRYKGNSFSVDTYWDEYITEIAFLGK